MDNSDLMEQSESTLYRSLDTVRLSMVADGHHNDAIEHHTHREAAVTTMIEVRCVTSSDQRCSDLQELDQSAVASRGRD